MPHDWGPGHVTAWWGGVGGLDWVWLGWSVLRMARVFKAVLQND